MRYFRDWLASPLHAVGIHRLGTDGPERPTMTTTARSRRLETTERSATPRAMQCNLDGGVRRGDEAEHRASRKATEGTSQ